MRRLTGVILALTPLLTTGCAVQSTRPYYTDKDLANEDVLIGEWVSIRDELRDPPGMKEMRFVVTAAPDGGYRITLRGEFTDSSLARLFRLGDHYFVDVEDEKHLHTLYRVAVLGSRLHVRTPSIDVVGTALERQKDIRCRVSRRKDQNGFDEVVFDAPTEQVQAFLRPRVNEPGWFHYLWAFEKVGGKVPITRSGLAGEVQRNLEFWCELRVRWREVATEARTTAYGAGEFDRASLLKLRDLGADAIDPDLAAAAADSARTVESFTRPGEEPEVATFRLTRMAAALGTGPNPPAGASPGTPERLGADLRKRLDELPAKLTKKYGVTFPPF
ncbi:MAG TPA: hypothetical protein VKE74_35340 [Gemmataceae bacterium]|nr:hypothetical protein [Gemmataceae bacterium]